MSDYIAKQHLPRADKGIALARELGVSASWLFDDTQGFPEPVQDLSQIPDESLMDEACRRLVNQAKRVAFDLERVQKEKWPQIADELLKIPATEDLPPNQERISFVLSLLAGSAADLQEFDATRAIKRRRYDGPDLDDLAQSIKTLKAMPEFEVLTGYFSLRHVADFLKRHNATQEEKDARNVEGHRKDLIATLARKRKEKSAKG